jgi:hypothetical protein
VGIAVAAVAFAAVTLVCVLIAWPSMHTILYEDEGYMLTVLKSFLNQGSLYDDVFAQYGPLYYEFWGGLFSLFGIPLTQDAARLVSLIVWVGSSLGLGLVTVRVTRSVVLGLAVQIIVFSALGIMVNEPMHPGGLICLLLVALVCIASFVGAGLSVWPMALLGSTLAALILVKVNVGVFALAALALVCAHSYTVLSSRRWLRLAIEMAFVALPILLVTSKVGEGWARHYGVHVAIAALAIVIALRARTAERRETEELWWIGGGLLAVGVTTCLAILGAGTSLGGLFEGVVIQPLRQGDAFTLPLQLTSRTWFYDAIGLSGAIGYWYATRHRQGNPGPAWTGAISILSIVIGIQLSLSVIGRTLPADSANLPGYAFVLLAFAWVALIQLPGRPDPPTAFVRLFLPPLAVLQMLHGFPVAGSQVMWGAFLLVAVGAICVVNGVRGMASVFGDRFERRSLAAIGAVAAFGLAFFLVNASLREPLEARRQAYDANVPLGLPGASSVRLTAPEVEIYREITQALDRHCEWFLTEPGMDAFYIWTRQEPPTGYNATAWMTLFDDAQQRRVIEDTRSIDGLCLLRNTGLAEGWSRGPVPTGPLVRYLKRGFEPIVSFGPYELLRREGAAGA